jgi:hypothetical protein
MDHIHNDPWATFLIMLRSWYEMWSAYILHATRSKSRVRDESGHRQKLLWSREVPDPDLVEVVQETAKDLTDSAVRCLYTITAEKSRNPDNYHPCLCTQVTTLTFIPWTAIMRYTRDMKAKTMANQETWSCRKENVMMRPFNPTVINSGNKSTGVITYIPPQTILWIA